MSVDGAQPDGLTLLDRVEAYLVRWDCTATWFGWLATGSPSLVARMRSGRRLRPTTAASVMAQLARQPLIQRTRRQTRGSIVASKYAQAVQDQRQREQEERIRRATDPVERAALFLRRQGWSVYRARVIDETLTGWACGRLRLDDQGLLDRARSKGWEG